MQALTAGGKTASGAGATRDGAFARCLGETAEILALAALPPEAQPADTSRIGIAAHEDADRAREAACLEAFERYAVHAWWNGDIAAHAIPQAWLESSGLNAALSAARGGAAVRRRTSWLWLEVGDGHPPVMICRSTSLAGQDAILGYAAARCPVRAARKALRENILMELNLMETMAARSLGQSQASRPLEAKVRHLTSRSARLMPAGESEPLSPKLEGDIAIPEMQKWLTGEVELRDISLPENGLHVWMCQPVAAPMNVESGDGLPYL